MRSFWVDPYLWIHLVGIAAVPIFLEFCLVGLSIGEPLFPAWFELLFVGAIGILPILWMQWQRPFSIFSLLVLALKPTQLTEDQRRILSLFKSPINQVLAALVAVAMTWVLWQLYQLAPAVSPNLFPGVARGTALFIAALAFFGANLFLQIPVSVLGVLWTSNSQFAATAPYPVEQIRQGFTIPGIRVGAIVPPLFSEPVKAKVPASPPSPTVAQSSGAPPAPSPIVAPDQPIASVGEPRTAELDEDEFEDEPESVADAEDAIVDVAGAVADDIADAEDAIVDVADDIADDVADNIAADAETAATVEPDVEVERDDMAVADTDAADPMADTPASDPSLPATLLRESESFRLTETADITEEVPIAESVVERLVSPEGSQDTGITSAAADPEFDPEFDPAFDMEQTDAIDRTADSPEDAAASSIDTTTESINPPPDMIEDATLSETVESQDEDVIDR
jgi:hypothetical protein